MSQKFGIDVSHCQGDFNFARAKSNEGVEFAIIKAGGGDAGLYKDSKFEGEFMMTVLASLAQEESRSISENNKWSIGKCFERGEGMINTTRFMGYDKDETGDLVVNKAKDKIVRRIFDE